MMRLASINVAGRRMFRPPSLSTSFGRSIRTLAASANGVSSKKKAVRTTTRLSELPKARLDESGQPAAPLQAYVDRAAVPTRRRSSIAKAEPKAKVVDDNLSDAEQEPREPSAEEEEAAVQQAIADGVIPSSALAKEVYLNWRRFPDCILLTRVGKFYESYFEPARELSAILGIKLAFKRYDEGQFPFAGFPVVRLDKYLKILVQDLGRTVVLVEEYDNEGALAEVGKKVTGGSGPKERRVYRVVTPGTMVDEGWLNGDESRYLLAIAVGQQQAGLQGTEEEDTLSLSLAYTDASTGEFFTKETTMAQMEDELARIAPSEVVLDRTLKDAWQDQETDKTTVEGPSDLFSLLRVLGVHVSFANSYGPTSSTPLGLRTESDSAGPASAERQAIALLRHHLQYALRDSMPALAQPNRQPNTSFMQIDAATLQALEIRHALRPGGLMSFGESRGVSPLSTRGTLLSVISKTITPSGHRLLIRTLTSPSTDLKVINSRLELVQALVDRQELREELRDMLKNVGDVVRIIQRFRGQRGDGRDVWDVGRWIRIVERMLGEIRQQLAVEQANGRRQLRADISEGVKRLKSFVDTFEPLVALAERIEASIDEEAIMFGIEGEIEEEIESLEPDAASEEMTSTIDTGVVKESKRERLLREREEREAAARYILPTFSEELQILHEEIASIKVAKDKMQLELRKRFDTPSLTLEKSTRYGYHLSINRSEAVKVIKARSLENIGGTKTSKAFFAFGPWSALGARAEVANENLFNAQRKAFRDLRMMVVERSESIQRNAELVDELDLSLSFAQNAVEMHWVRPVLNDSTELHITAGRHPSIESSLLTSSRTFTPNSTHMTPASHLHIITGPNQGGKSTLLRQTAVIAILAQSGSFVPASQAVIGVVDKVFSRVGARDDLWRDRSTFMLEMVETAGILKHATNRSLVIMDEIGRGTTLQAGVSIAYAALDHILENIKCRTLFATHYHELGRMLGYDEPDDFEGISLAPCTSSNASAEDIVKEGRLEVGAARAGVSFWCTDIEETDGAFSYSYKLRKGINHTSHAIKAARLAGMPESFLRVAERTLRTVQQTGKFDPPGPSSSSSSAVSKASTT